MGYNTTDAKQLIESAILNQSNEPTANLIAKFLYIASRPKVNYNKSL